jgi:hypothetical protein
MDDDRDEFVLLLLRTSGMGDAVLTYEEETGASHAEATTAVQSLARQRGLDKKIWPVGKLAATIVTALTAGAVSVLVIIHSA